MITIRNPMFDFSKTRPSWARSIEFAHMFNGMSMLFPPLERYLNRVMIMARAKITGTDPESVRIREDIDLFVRQEGVHYTIHSQFNKMLEDGGFPKLPDFETQMEQEYRDFLKTKSLRFLTGYCEGFEILGPIYAKIWLDEIDDLFEGADPEAVAMWKWHISEEFEHRTVCFDVYNKLFGGYFYRLYAMHCSHKHQGTFIAKVMGYMLKQEWSKMTEAEVAASKKRLKAISRRIKWLALPRVLRVYLPWYTPRKAAMPGNLKATIDAIESTYLPQAA